MIEAHRWQQNGDHPGDNCQVIPATLPGDEYSEFWSEGRVVRYYRNPDLDGGFQCPLCGITMHLHGWIEPENSIGVFADNGNGTVVCPGSMIITAGLGFSDTPRYEVMGYPEFHRRYKQVGNWPTCCYVERGIHVWERKHPRRVSLSFRMRTFEAKADHRRLLLNLKIAQHIPWRLKSAIIIAETNRYSLENPQAEVPAIPAFELIKTR
jgi:hypothetical protein